MYCLIYCINIYILFCYVVELYALRGAEGWWGSQLAWIRNSLIIYVTTTTKLVQSSLFAPQLHDAQVLFV